MHPPTASQDQMRLELIEENEEGSGEPVGVVGPDLDRPVQVPSSSLIVTFSERRPVSHWQDIISSSRKPSSDYSTKPPREQVAPRRGIHSPIPRGSFAIGQDNLKVSHRTSSLRQV